eukprot:RCo041972
MKLTREKIRRRAAFLTSSSNLSSLEDLMAQFLCRVPSFLSVGDLSMQAVRDELAQVSVQTAYDNPDTSWEHIGNFPDLRAARVSYQESTKPAQLASGTRIHALLVDSSETPVEIGGTIADLPRSSVARYEVLFDDCRAYPSTCGSCAVVDFTHNVCRVDRPREPVQLQSGSSAPACQPSSAVEISEDGVCTRRQRLLRGAGHLQTSKDLEVVPPLDCVLEWDQAAVESLLEVSDYETCEERHPRSSPARICSYFCDGDRVTDDASWDPTRTAVEMVALDEQSCTAVEEAPFAEPEKIFVVEGPSLALPASATSAVPLVQPDTAGAGEEGEAIIASCTGLAVREQEQSVATGGTQPAVSAGPAEGWPGAARLRQVGEDSCGAAASHENFCTEPALLPSGVGIAATNGEVLAGACGRNQSSEDDAQPAVSMSGSVTAVVQDSVNSRVPAPPAGLTLGAAEGKQR